MLTNTQIAALLDGATNLQKRIASGYSFFGTEHLIAVAINVSTWQGQVVYTIQPDQPSSTAEWKWFKTIHGLFADSVVFDNKFKARAAMYEVATRVWSLMGESTLVVNVTFQETTRGVAIDYVVQVYIENGKLVVRTVTEVD